MPNNNQQTGIKGLVFKIALIIVLPLLMIAFYSCSKDRSPIRIGAALPLSGPAAFVGEEVRDGLALAVNRINDSGGINGHPIELIIQNAAEAPPDKSDNSSEKKTVDPAQLAFNALIKKDPLLIVNCLSFLAMKLAPLAEAHSQLMVSLVATVPELTVDKTWVYRYWPTAEHEAPPMMDLFQQLEKQGGGLGVIYLDDAYGQSVFSNLKQRCMLFGTPIVSASFPMSQKTFFDQAEHVKSASAVAIVGFDSHIIGALKALRRMNYSGEIISTTTATLPSVTQIPESQGIHVTAPAIYNKNYHFADEVQQLYRKTYGKPFTQYSANGYDFIYVLAGLLEDQPITSKSVKALLDKGFVYSGIFGNIELKKGEKDIFFPLFPAQIQQGKIIYR